MLTMTIALALAAPQCTALDTRLPPRLKGWTRTGTTLDTGRSVLIPRRGATLATRVTIRRPGLFGIAIDQPGWIDVAPERGRALKMAGEARGPACSTIRKIVRYNLAPGAYRVSVSRLRADRARLMLVHYGPDSPRENR